MAGSAPESGVPLPADMGRAQGHAVCDKPEWINGLSNPTVESFHRNALGHEAFGRLVWQKVKP